MDPREELQALRRMAELEARAGGAPAPAAPAPEPTWGQRGQEGAQGLKGRFDEMALGIKGLLPQGVQDLGDRIDRAVGSGGLTKATATPIPDTWAGAVGSGLADAATTLVPAGAMARGASLVAKALPMSLGKRMLTEAGMNVAGPVSYTHLTLPTTPYV